MNQRKYILDLVSDLGLITSKPTATPMIKGVKLVNNPINDDLCDVNQYIRLVGRLFYFTRPDIAYCV